MRKSHRLVVALLGASLLTSACGARLSDDQLALATSRGSGSGVGTSVDAGGFTFDETTGEVVDAGAGGEAVVDPATAGASAGTTAGGGATAGSSGSAGGKAAPAGTAGAKDTRSAPPGGNGGSTDTGVTADTITIANASDVGGAVPGLFEDAQLAVKAYVAYFTASEGTIYGRKLKLLALDSRLDSGANRTETIKACNEAFAGVGSMSGFDHGGAPVLRDCKMPDIRPLPTTDQMKDIPNVFGVMASGKPGHRGLGMYKWATDKFPDAVKQAGYLYTDGEVTRQVAEQDMEATRAIGGYEWKYSSGIGVTETNFAPFVQQLKSQNIRLVVFTGAYQQAASLAKKMQEQGYKPDVFLPTATAYTPNYIKLAGAAGEGTFVPVQGSLVEEIGSNPEMQLYAKWLNQVEPGARPTAIGQFAWGAAKLFVEKAKEIGPDLKRDKMVAALSQVQDYTANGLFPAQDIGPKTWNDCMTIVRVQGGKFVRFEPTTAGKPRCGDGVYDTAADKRLS